MKVWLPWSELVGSKRITLTEYRGILRQYPRGALLIACSRLSIIFGYGPNADTTPDENLAAEWIPKLFHPALVPRVQDFAAQGRIIFFQGQLRFLAAEVMRLEPPHADESIAFSDAALGGLLLAAGELLYKPHVKLSDNLDILVNLVAEFLPTYEIDSKTEPLMLFLRFYIYLTIIIPLLPQNLAWFNVDERFEECFGFPLARYLQFIYCFILHANTERSQVQNGKPIDGALRASWFKTTTVPEDHVKQMFKTVSFSLGDLPDSKPPLGYGDFEFLRNLPYFNHESGMYCLDYEFALNKLESGALWGVLRNLGTEKLTYLSFWGNVFERYVAWIFDTYANKRLNAFYEAPQYEHDKERPICDAVILCGYTAVLVEVKLATCSAAVRYSGDYVRFKKYLEERLVTGTGREVGVSQLVTATENLATLPDTAKPAFLRNVRKFVPLIITKDEIGSSWVLNAYLDARFDQKLDRKKCKPYTVTPLVSMNISTLERSLLALSKHSFSEILEDRIRSDRKLGRPFEAASSFVHPGPARGAFKHLEIMEKLSNDLIANFGVSDEPSSSA